MTKTQWRQRAAQHSRERLRQQLHDARQHIVLLNEALAYERRERALCLLEIRRVREEATRWAIEP